LQKPDAKWAPKIGYVNEQQTKDIKDENTVLLKKAFRICFTKKGTLLLSSFDEK